MSAPAIATVKRELLVRYLEVWAPSALRHGRRVTYVHGYADADGGAAAEAAARVLAEQSDLVRGRELSMLAVGENVDELGVRLTGILQAAGATAGLNALTISGGTDAR